MDFIGLGLLTIGLASLELMLDKGQEHDWFDSPFIVWLGVIAAAALVATVFWELRHPAPIINLRLFRDRNFSAAAVCVFCRVRRPLRQQRAAAADAPDADGLLGPERRPGALARRVRDDARDAGHRHDAQPGRRCAQDDRRRPC